MALGPPFVVRVEQKSDGSFGQTMSEVRSWLDHRKIEPLRFKPLANAESGFEISFNSEAEAILFGWKFQPVQQRPLAVDPVLPRAEGKTLAHQA